MVFIWGDESDSDDDIIILENSNQEDSDEADTGKFLTKKNDDDDDKYEEIMIELDKIKNIKSNLTNRVDGNIVKIRKKMKEVDDELLDVYNDEQENPLYKDKTKFKEFDPVSWFQNKLNSQESSDGNLIYANINGRIIEFKEVQEEDNIEDWEEEEKLDGDKEAYVGKMTFRKYKGINRWMKSAVAKSDGDEHQKSDGDEHHLYYGKYMKIVGGKFKMVHLLIDKLNFKDFDNINGKSEELFNFWKKQVFGETDEDVDDEAFYRSMALKHDYSIKGWKQLLNFMERNVMVKNTLKSHCNKRYTVSKSELSIKSEITESYKKWKKGLPWCYACGLPLVYHDDKERQWRELGSDCDHLLSLLPTVLLHSMQDEETPELYLPMHAWCNQTLKSEKLMNMQMTTTKDENFKSKNVYCPFIEFNESDDIEKFCNIAKLDWSRMKKALDGQMDDDETIEEKEGIIGVAKISARKELYSESVKKALSNDRTKVNGRQLENKYI